MKSKKIQIGVIALGIVGYILGFLTILQVPTMLMSPLYLALILTVPVLIVSLMLGVATSIATDFKWHWITFSILYLGSISFILFAFEYRDLEKVEVVLDEDKPGHYFIIATSDKNKASNYDGYSVHFDRHNVIYLDSSLYNKAFIEPVNHTGKSLTKRVKSWMGNQYYQHFYNPSNQEYLKYPDWSVYYHKYQYPLELDKEKLEKLGYIFTDTLLVINKSNSH